MQRRKNGKAENTKREKVEKPWEKTKKYFLHIDGKYNAGRRNKVERI